jgi:hypothetical protein
MPSAPTPPFVDASAPAQLLAGMWHPVIVTPPKSHNNALVCGAANPLPDSTQQKSIVALGQERKELISNKPHALEILSVTNISNIIYQYQYQIGITNVNVNVSFRPTTAHSLQNAAGAHLRAAQRGTRQASAQRPAQASRRLN